MLGPLGDSIISHHDFNLLGYDTLDASSSSIDPASLMDLAPSHLQSLYPLLEAVTGIPFLQNPVPQMVAVD